MKTALVAVAKDEDLYIDEWIKYHSIIGFDDIYLYGDDWIFSNANMYSNVHFEFVPRKNLNAVVKNPQVSVYREFCNKNWSKYDWAAFFDIDEFLVLNEHKNLQKFLDQYENFPGIFVNWLQFGDNGHQSIVDNYYSVIDRFTKSAKNISTVGKSIVNFNVLHNDFTMHCHNIMKNDNGFCLVDVNKFKVEPKSDINGGVSSKASNDMLNKAYLAHYRTKTYQEFKTKVERNIDGCGDKDWTVHLNQFNQNNFNEVENYDVWKLYYEKN